MKPLFMEQSFEVLSQDEWNKYLEMDIFKDMTISDTDLDLSNPIFYLRLSEVIKEYNNKVGSLRVSYALCKHYYDKGIPDDPWYDKKANKYMPLFKEEHWTRKYWFSYFADAYYLKIFSMWDSIIEIINQFYNLGFESKCGVTNKVIEYLEKNTPDLHKNLEEIKNDKIYKNANKYRVAAAHGTSLNSVRNTVNIKNNVSTEMLVLDDFGKPILDDKGKLIKEKTMSSTQITVGVGDYINAKAIMDNMEEFATFLGKKVKDVISILSKERQIY